MAALVFPGTKRGPEPRPSKNAARAPNNDAARSTTMTRNGKYMA